MPLGPVTQPCTWRSWVFLPCHRSGFTAEGCPTASFRALRQALGLGKSQGRLGGGSGDAHVLLLFLPQELLGHERLFWRGNTSSLTQHFRSIVLSHLKAPVGKQLGFANHKAKVPYFFYVFFFNVS